MTTSTWIDLLGTDTKATHVADNCIVRMEGQRQKVLWTFDTMAEAWAAYVAWREEIRTQIKPPYPW